MVLDDAFDSANGSAQVLPYPVIRLYAHPPALDSSLAGPGPWLDRLVLHEATHILHMLQAGGVHRALNRLLGPQDYPNQVLPTWFVEGLATWVESLRPWEGRLHHPRYLGRKRITLLEGDDLPLDRLTTGILDPPGGAAPYMFGGSLLGSIAARHGGSLVLANFVHEYGRRLFPYGLNTSLRAVSGTDFLKAYQLFLSKERAAAREEARGRGGAAGEGQRLSGPTLAFSALEYVPALDMVLTMEDDGHDENALVLRDPATGAIRWRRNCYGACGMGASASADGRQAIVAIQTPIGPIRRHGDLYGIPLLGAETLLGGGERRRWTRGARLARPDAHRWPELPVLAVATRSGRTSIVALNGPGTDPRTLVPGNLDRRLDMPRWANRGGSFVYAVQTDEESWLMLASLDGDEERILLRTRWPAIHPVFSTDDRSIWLSSPVDGVYELLQIQVGTEGKDPRACTRSVGGTDRVAPLPGGGVLFLAMRGRGWSMQRLRGCPSARPPSPRPMLRPDPLVGEAPDQRAPWARGETADIREEAVPYLHLLRPRALIPRLGFASGRGSSLALQISGADPLGHHSLFLELSTPTLSTAGAHLPDLLARYDYGGAPADLGILYLDADSPRLWFDGATVFEAAARFRLVGLQISRRLPGILRAERITFSTNLVLHSGAGPDFQRDPGSRVPVPLRPGIFPFFELTLSHGGRYGFLYGVVAERGLDVSVSLRFDPAVSRRDVERWRLSYGLNTPLRAPGLPHLVLTNLVRGRLSLAPVGSREQFAVGGIGPTTAVQDLLDQRVRGFEALRGFPPLAFSGAQSQIWTADLSFPIFDPLRGLDSLPLAVRRVVVAAFFDGAWIGPYRLDASDVHGGAGGEIRVEVDADLGFRPVLRLGAARGLGSSGIFQAYLVVGTQP